MSNYLRDLGAVCALTALALFSACNDGGDRQSNPHFSSGGSAAGGKAGAAAGGEAPAGASNGDEPAGGQAAGGVPSALGGAGAGGDGGPPPVEPPYDCVLEPKTHLEIINACTDATRIEKSPELPPIP